MNIQRYHIDSHLYPPPHVPVGREAGEASDAPAIESAPRSMDGGVQGSIDSRYQSELSSEPEIRNDVVAAARVIVARGELLTRAAAKEAATAFLRQVPT